MVIPGYPWLVMVIPGYLWLVMVIFFSRLADGTLRFFLDRLSLSLHMPPLSSGRQNRGGAEADPTPGPEAPPGRHRQRLPGLRLPGRRRNAGEHDGGADPRDHAELYALVQRLGPPPCPVAAAA